MFDTLLTPTNVLAFLNVAMSSVLIILSFSLMAYTLMYNVRQSVARRFALLLLCVMIAYASEVALTRVNTVSAANAWLRFQWLGIALLPAASYLFSLAVLRLTNYGVRRRRYVAAVAALLSVTSALLALFTNWLVGSVRATSTLSFLEAGPLFPLFTLFFVVANLLALGNIWLARERCLTARTRTRMTYLLVGFAAPAIGVFPYLGGLSGLTLEPTTGVRVLLLSLVVNALIAPVLVIISYTVAYFGVLTPDRVVRYRMLRFFTRGPIVAIVVIVAMQALPAVDSILGLPRDIVLYTVATGVIVLSQLLLSVSRPLVDRAIYRGDRDEVAWLRELDRRLLTTSDLRQFLENNLLALCELLRVRAGVVAAVVGVELVLEAIVGPEETRKRILDVESWSEVLSEAVAHSAAQLPDSVALSAEQVGTVKPLSLNGFWVWPLLEPAAKPAQRDSGEADKGGEPSKVDEAGTLNGHVRALDNALVNPAEGASDGPRVLGLLAVEARTQAPLLSQREHELLRQLVERVASALVDRALQQNVFVALRRIIPEIDRIQRLRGLTPYASGDAGPGGSSAVPTLLESSPIHDPEFETWVKEALVHYWGGPKLTRSPLMRMKLVGRLQERVNNDPTKALRLALDTAIEQLKPEGKQDLSAPEWLLYNILEMRFREGRKVHEIGARLATSQSDYYRKQRVAVAQVARVLSEMEQGGGPMSQSEPPDEHSRLEA